MRTKKVWIKCEMPVFDVIPNRPIVGQIGSINLTIDQIRKCLVSKANVREILPDGSIRVLDLTNYDKFDDEEESVEEVKQEPTKIEEKKEEEPKQPEPEIKEDVKVSIVKTNPYAKKPETKVEPMPNITIEDEAPVTDNVEIEVAEMKEVNFNDGSTVLPDENTLDNKNYYPKKKKRK